jgi:ribonuclease P protein component
MTLSAPRESVSRRIDFELLGRARRASQGVVSVSFAPSTPTPSTLAAEVVATEHTGSPSVRIAYGVSRHTGGAVVRNRIRRRFRAVMTELSLEPGLYMVRPRNGITEASFRAIRSDLLAVCTRLGALQSEGQLSVAQNTPSSSSSLSSPGATGVFE